MSAPHEIRIIDADLDEGFELDEGSLLFAAAAELGKPIPPRDLALIDEAIRLHDLGQTL